MTWPNRKFNKNINQAAGNFLDVPFLSIKKRFYLSETPKS